MKQEILSNLENPSQLERLYRTDRSAFRQAFNAVYPELKHNCAAGFWDARLNYSKEDISWGTSSDLVFMFFAALIAGFVAKMPALLHIEADLFYQRNVGFIIFPALSAYFAWKNELAIGKIAFVATVTVGSLIFINSLPHSTKSDTLILSCAHLLLLLWSMLGFAFVGGKENIAEKRLGFLIYNGDLVVMTTLILIAGAILSGVTFGLFSLIGINIQKFYSDYALVFGLPAAPILATFLIQTNPQIVGKVSPVIAKIFSPLVLVMLVTYLIAIIYSGKDPYNDRESLLIFNGLLVGVMAIIFFSVAERSKTTQNQAGTWVLLLLSFVTVLVNAIALSAILFRISARGITPNRAAVLGSNILILINLLLVTIQLFKVVSKRSEISGVGNVISFYLPVYIIWAAVVTFIFPFVFGFK